MRLHWGMARARGRLVRVTRGIPPRVQDTLKTVLGDGLAPAEIERIARRNTEFVSGFEQLKTAMPRFCDPGARSRCQVVGSEFLDEALASGRGAIILTAHLGYSKLIGPILRSHHYEATDVVAKSLQSFEQETRFDRWLESLGSVSGSILRPVRRTAYERDCIPAQLDVRPIFAALARNKPVVLAGDGLKAAEFAHLPLLGGSYPFAKGFMRIAMLTKAAVLPTFGLEGKNGHWIAVVIGPPLNIDPAASVEENIMRFAEVLEAQIRRTPHLWFRWADKEALEALDERPTGEWVDRWNRGLDL